MCNKNKKRLQFLEKTQEYVFVQEKGQRILYKKFEDREPEKGSEIFVGNICSYIFEEELFLVFYEIGTIYELRVMIDYDLKNRGFCFVKYNSKEIAEQAINKLNGHKLGKRRITVVKSLNNCRLYFGNIPTVASANMLYDELEQRNIVVKDIIMYPSLKNTFLNRGYAFVEFSDHNYALTVFKQLKKEKLRLWNTSIKVDWADPLPDPDSTVMQTVTRLYLRNLPTSTTREELMEFFIQKNIPSHHITKVYVCKDYAFVHLDCRLQAEYALNVLQGSTFADVNLEVEWARPNMYSKQVQKTLPPKTFCLSVPAKTRNEILRIKGKIY